MGAAISDMGEGLDTDEVLRTNEVLGANNGTALPFPP
jgi:hypothetical protein